MGFNSFSGLSLSLLSSDISEDFVDYKSYVVGFYKLFDGFLLNFIFSFKLLKNVEN